MEIYNELNLTKEIAKKDIYFCLKNAFKNRPFSTSRELFENSPQIYINSNEQIRFVTEKIKPGDRIITVASSGDYLLDAVYKDAKEIITFDINKYQYYIEWLKCTAINVLEYEEYINFFFNEHNPLYLSEEIFNKLISSFSSSPESIFWKNFVARRKIDKINIERVLEKYKRDFSYEAVNSELRAMGEKPLSQREYYVFILSLIEDKLNLLTEKMIIQSCANNESYLYSLNKNNYEETKEKIKLKTIHFYRCGIEELKKLKKYYNKIDKIMLSNIHSYIFGYRMAEIIKSTIFMLLKEEGEAFLINQNFKKEWLESYNKNTKYKILNEYMDESDERILKLSQLTAKNNLTLYKRLKDYNYEIFLEEILSLNGSFFKTDKDVLLRIKKHNLFY